MHNMSGRCDAGIVAVEEQILPEGGYAYCATLAICGDSANSLGDPAAAGGDIVCGVVNCRRNEGGLCRAARPTFCRAVPPERRLALCQSLCR